MATSPRLCRSDAKPKRVPKHRICKQTECGSFDSCPFSRDVEWCRWAETDSDEAIVTAVD